MSEEKIKERAAKYRDDMVEFLQDLVAIPSESCDEGGVVRRCKQELNDLGFDEIQVDEMGNIIGRIGDGERKLAIDGHIDTVGVSDLEDWEFDPYGGQIEDGYIFGRGTSDQTGGYVSAVYGAKIISDLGILPDDFSLYVVGSVQEEDCDGMCWDYMIEEDVLVPEAVIITEPTELDVKRGHRGRMEMQIDTDGVSCHGSAPHRGENAIYKMGPLVNQIEALNDDLRDHEFLGKGTIVLSQVSSEAPSLCAVPNACSAYLDRRLTVGETMESSLEEIRELPGFAEAEAEVFVPTYTRPSWTGFEYEFLKYYPTWCLEEDHPVIQSGVKAFENQFGESPTVTKWTFSTNGVTIAGRHGIPCLGFGPGEEQYAHAADERIAISDLVEAARFYAG
ncbi:MAG: YgeY family selenium metabolism-linked hydrolase, partial [bacterium]